MAEGFAHFRTLVRHGEAGRAVRVLPPYRAEGHAVVMQAFSSYYRQKMGRHVLAWDGEPVMAAAALAGIYYGQELSESIVTRLKQLGRPALTTQKLPDKVRISLQRQVGFARIPHGAWLVHWTQIMLVMACGMGPAHAQAWEVIEAAYAGYKAPEHVRKGAVRRVAFGQRTIRVALPPALRFYIVERDRYRCQLCGVAARDGDDVRLEIAHITPVALGGRNERSNLWVLCQTCNNGKGIEIVQW